MSRYYLDITRILKKFHEETPTGIDRVELEYAKYFRKNKRDFVFQINDSLISIPPNFADEFVIAATRKWEKGIVPVKQPDIFKFHLLAEAQQTAMQVKALWDQGEIRAMFSLMFEGPQINGEVQEHINVVPRSYIIRNSVKEIISSGRHWKHDFSPSCEDWYINVGHHGLNKRSLFSKLKEEETGPKIAIYLHDLLPITHPDLFSENENRRHRKRINITANFADLVFANSQFTAAQLARRSSIKNAIVLEIGAAKQKKTPVTQARSGFVAIGTLEPRKNYLWLIRQWMEFCESRPDIAMKERLTIFGKRGWHTEEEHLTLLSLAEMAGNVDIVHGASDIEIRDRLRTCRALLAAALVEGWGMPLVEALTIGTPVIASAIPAHREATRKHATFYSKDDGQQLVEAIGKCFDHDQYQSMVQRARQFKPWNWAEHFNRFDNAIGVTR